MTKPISVKNKFGQYFTPKLIVDLMISLSKVDKDAFILEPSSGEGVFIESLKKRGFKNIIGYEIDKTLISNTNNIINESFITAKIDKKYDLIIGNPPYIRWKNLEKELKEELNKNTLWNKYFNSLCDYSYIFILKSIELLKDGGELIFITPEYWLNTKHSLNLRNYMVKNGYFEEIIHFNETPIFDKATVSTIIFKYIKSNKKCNSKIKLTKYYANRKLNSEIIHNLQNKIEQNNTTYLEIDQFEENRRWLLASNKVKNELKIFEQNCLLKNQKSLFDFETDKFHTIGDICDIGNGMVSGLDKAFQIKNIHHLNDNEKKHILKVIKAKDLKPFNYVNTTHYIFLSNIKDEEELKNRFPNFYNHLLPFKSKLEKRYNYNRNIPYWEWVFLRNYNLFSKEQERIFVPSKERISNKDYFRFALAEKNLYPTQDVTALFKKDDVKESIYYILAFLNNKRVFDWLLNNGVRKGNIVEFSEKPIASIPFRKINWDDKKEVSLHNKIVKLSKKTIEDYSNINKLNLEIDKLFKG